MSAFPGYVLGIESAIGGGSISLHRNGTEIGGRSGNGSVSRAEELLPQIDRLLREFDVTIRDLDVIIVSTGPGSYTGIRVGIATIMGLRASVSARCLGATVLQAMTSVAKDQLTVMTGVPMGRNMVCSQLFEGDRPTNTPKLNTADEFIESVVAFTGPVVVHGSLFDDIKDPGSVRLIDAGDNLASLVAAAASSGFASEDLTPLFVDRQ
jgi:tRNA threonylcarbamoyl adenosine modification protein YeaZ